MGEHRVQYTRDEKRVRAFTRAMLSDLRALEALIERGMIEHGVRRVGVEQEMFLVDPTCRPAPIASEVIARVGDPRFTTELACFNLEANLTPQPFGGRVLKRLEEDLSEVVGKAAEAAESVGARVLLTGILPTLRHGDLGLDNMSPEARFQQMNDALSRMRDGAFAVRIDGLEQFEADHDSVMLESANTSLQLHLQVSAEEFTRLYNLAQLISAPLLAAAANSPVLLGRRLWHETRIALFERSVDSRSSSQLARGLPSRVSFGDAWVQESATELFRENALRFGVIMTCDGAPNPFAQIEDGVPPTLPALMLHNGTVWRWNRPCYGVTEGKAHLRIENRVLPAGPTVLDEVANAALFYGMLEGLDGAYRDVASHVTIEDAKSNFIAAAQRGLDADLIWIHGRVVSAQALLLEELIPAAREGLTGLGVPSEDLDRYLGTVEERVRTRQTGARWLLDALAGFRGRTTPEAGLKIATEAMLKQQQHGNPVHCWGTVDLGHEGKAESVERTVAEIMTTDLFTVRPDDVVDLAERVMEWKHVRHVPVEARTGEVVGLLSHRALLRLYEHSADLSKVEPVPVETIMERNPPTVDPDTELVDAMRQLLAVDTGCLLVVSSGRLVGIVTERDFLSSALLVLESQRRRTLQ